MTQPSDTPQTDRYAFVVGPTPDEGFEAVNAGVARELERENTKLMDEVVAANGALDMAMKREAKLREAIAAIVKAWDSWGSQETDGAIKAATKL